MPRQVLVSAGLAFGLLAGMVRGEELPVGTAYPSCRGPYLLEIAPWAKPSRTPAYVGYYVGGGAPCHCTGEPRLPWEGTWGWDYSGYHFHRRVWLDWFHGRRYQGGTGAYETDGPELLKALHEDNCPKN